MNKQTIQEAFNKEGFVALNAFLSADALSELLENLERFIKEEIPNLPPEHVFYEDKSQKETLKQIQQLHIYDPYFKSLMTGSEFEALAKLLLNDDVIPKNMQYFNKAPGVGKPTPPHQDGYYFKLEPCEAVTLWLALDDVDEENGCVHYAVKSHELGLLEHDRTSTLGFSQGLHDLTPCQNPDTDLACIATTGDLLAHHALTIHWAGANKSKTRSRRALGFIYYAVSAKENVELHQEYQKNLTTEMTAQGKI